MDTENQESNGSCLQEIRTFVFFDLETTGITGYPRILELSMVAISREELSEMEMSTTDVKETTPANTEASTNLGAPLLPRVLHKYTRLYYPKAIIHPIIEDITGLSNEALCHLAPFSESDATSLKHFLDLPPPVCLVAHNGNMFDFPILKAELLNISLNILSDVLCVDSLRYLRELETCRNTNIFEELTLENNKGLSKEVATTSLPTGARKPCIRHLTYDEELEIDEISKMDLNYVVLDSSPSFQHSMNESKSSIVKAQTSVSPKDPLFSYRRIVVNGPLTYAEEIEVSETMEIFEMLNDDFDDLGPFNHSTKLMNTNRISPNFKYEKSTYETPTKDNRAILLPKTPIKCSYKVAQLADNSVSFTPSTPKLSELNTPNKRGVKRSLCCGNNSTSPRHKSSLSQPKLFKRLFGVSYDAHSAEADAVALLQICSYYSSDFLRWADRNFVKFQDVDPKWKYRNSFKLEKPN